MRQLTSSPLAFAQVTEAMAAESIAAPRGLQLPTSLVRCRRALQPTITSSVGFKALYRAYLASRCVLHLTGNEDVIRLLESEDAELDAARNRLAPPELLPPRHVSCTLLLRLHESETRELAFHFLNALAIVASSFDACAPVANALRITVLVNEDAAAYVARHGIASACGTSCATIATRIASHLHVQTAPLSLSTNPHTMIGSIQSILLEHTKHVNLAPHVFSTRVNVPLHAWATAIALASNAFAALRQGAPSLTRSEAVLAHRIVLKEIGWLRLAPRDQDVDSPNCFHGLLLSSEDCVLPYEEIGSDVVAPTKLHLHTAAVQTTRVHVPMVCGHLPSAAQLVAAIHRNDAAIVPITCVLGNFRVFCCSRQSILPSNERLHAPYLAGFDLISPLLRRLSFTALTASPATTVTATTAPKIYKQLQCDIPPPSAEDEQVLALFGVHVASSPMLLGDLYSHLLAKGAPATIVGFIQSLCLKVGLGCPVGDAFAHGQALLDSFQSHKAQQLHAASLDREERITNAALRVGAKRHRVGEPNIPKTPNIPNLSTTSEPRGETLSKKRFQSLLTVLRVKVTHTASVQLQDPVASSFSSVVTLIALHVSNLTVEDAVMHDRACELARQVSLQGAHAVLCSLLVLLESPKHMVFLTSNKSGTESSKIHLWDGNALVAHTLRAGVGGNLPMLIVKCEARSLVVGTIG